MSSLEDRLQGGSSVPWIPQEEKAAKYENDSYNEQTVIGIAVDHFTRRNFNDDGDIDVVVLNVEGVGDVAIHCGPTVLANQMRTARPRPGERVGVSYKGERTGARNIAYHDYVVKVDRQVGGEFGWADGGHSEPESTDPVTEYTSTPPKESTAADYTDIPF